MRAFQWGIWLLCSTCGSGYKSHQSFNFHFFAIYLVNQAFFRSFNFDVCYLQSHLCYRKVIYLIGKLSYSAFWRSKDMGRGSSIKAPTPILMNSYEFHLNRLGCFVLKATPYVFKRPKSWILGLSNEVYYFSVAQILLEIFGQNGRTFLYRTDTF